MLPPHRPHPTDSSLLEALFNQCNFTPNPNQRAAIEHEGHPLFLVAGPGSGKTRVLLWRTVRLIAVDGIAPADVFLATFTEKAAKQLRDGLVTLLGIASQLSGAPYDISGMYVGTVHSLCHRLLGDRSLTEGRSRKPLPAVLDALDQYFELASGSFWRSAAARLQHTGELSELRLLINGAFEPPQSASRHKAVLNLQSLFNRLTEENIDPDVLLSAAAPEHRPLTELYALYRERLGERRVDLALLQQAAYRTLCAEPDAIYRFRHVIVDEYQDTNTIQEQIFFRLASGWGNLCVVGDDDQALYRFRGATVENFVRFPERCEAGLGRAPTRIALNINYRSRRSIVDACGRFIQGADWSRPEGGSYRLQDKGIRAENDDPLPAVVAGEPAEPPDVAEEIARLVRGLLDRGAVSDPNQIAFLFPSLKSRAVEHFEAALARQGLKVYAPRARRFLEADEPTLIIGLLGQVLGRPARDDSYDKGEYAEFHSWLDQADTRARELVKGDPALKAFLTERTDELSSLKRDFVALRAVLEKQGWAASELYQPPVHKRALLGALGLSPAARRALGGTGLDRLQVERALAGRPLNLGNVLSRSTTADWGLLDLFYRLLGSEHLRALLDLADGGRDEGPTCNLSLTSQLLARYTDTFPALITGAGLVDKGLQNGFYHAFLLALFRLGEGEYEDAEDPFPRGRIPFLTIHQSKGLEFPVVVLGSARSRRAVRKVEELVRPYLPPGGEPLDRMGDFDAMRMFYVALSRAENLLILAQPKGKGQRVDEEVKALLEAGVPRISTFDLSTVPTARGEPSALSRRYSYTGDYQSYLRCPRQYMLFERYGFAASRTQTMFFGSLVHATIEDLHHHLIAGRSGTADAS